MSWALASGPWTGRPQQELTELATWKLSPRQADPSSLSITIDGTTPEAANILELRDDLWLFAGGQVVFRGRITQSSDNLDDAHQITMSAVDYRGVLDRRLMWDNWTLIRNTVDPVDDAWALIAAAQAEPGGNLGIVRGARPADVVTVAQIKHDAGSTVLSGITADAKLSPGFDWDITPTGETGLRADMWRNSRGRVTDVALEYSSGTAQRQVDSTAYGNSVRLPGGTDVSNNPLPAVRRDASDVATRAEGRWDLAVQDDSSFTTVAAGAARANYELAHAILQPSYTLTLTDGIWRSPADFWLGDTVTLQIRSGRLLIDEPLPVVQLDVSNSADRPSPQVSVTLGSYTYEQQQRLRLRGIQRQLGALQRR